MYWDLYDKVKKIIKKYAFMKLHDASRPLYLGTDASGVGLDAGFLQVREGLICPRGPPPDNAILRPKAFGFKCLSGVETCYSNIERKALGIFHELQKFHHYCFAKEVKNQHRPKMLGHCIQERCSNTFTKIVVHIIENTPI